MSSRAQRWLGVEGTVSFKCVHKPITILLLKDPHLTCESPPVPALSRPLRPRLGARLCLAAPSFNTGLFCHGTEAVAARPLGWT